MSPQTSYTCLSVLHVSSELAASLRQSTRKQLTYTCTIQRPTQCIVMVVMQTFHDGPCRHDCHATIFQRLSQDLLKMVLVVMMVMQTTFQGLSQDVFRMVLVVMMIMHTTFQRLSQDVFKMVLVSSTSDTECAHNWS